MKVKFDSQSKVEDNIIYAVKYTPIELELSGGERYSLTEEKGRLYISTYNGKLAALGTGGVNVMQIRTLELNA